MENGTDYRLTFKDILICICPVLNIACAGWLYKRDWVLGVLCLGATLNLLARIYIILNYADIVEYQVYSLYAMLATSLIYWVYLIISVYIILNDSGVVFGFQLAIMSIVFPIGQYYIGAFLSKTMEFDRSREDTFKWQD